VAPEDEQTSSNKRDRGFGFRSLAGLSRNPQNFRAVTVSGFQVLSTTWKSTDGTASHWKYIVDNLIVYRDLYCEGFVSRAKLTSNFRFARNPSRIDAKHGDHFVQADLNGTDPLVALSGLLPNRRLLPGINGPARKDVWRLGEVLRSCPRWGSVGTRSSRPSSLV
jgi:hypothetical protein